MSKIRISCKNNKITFSLSPEKREIDQSNLNLTKTNVINTDSMIFTSNYMLKNPEIVSSFIQGIAFQRNISKVYIMDKEIISLVLLVIINIKNFTEIYLMADESIDYEVYERLLYSPYISYVNCYNMKHFMIEKLDNKNTVVEIREEMFFQSNFMNDNDLKYYSSIYYKKSLDIKQNMNENDWEDFDIFCRINKYLKIINLHYFSLEIIRNIIRNLVKYKIKNIKIQLFENSTNTSLIINSIEYLKLIQNQVKKEHNFNLKIIYSNEYKSKNFFTQISISNLKFSSFLIIITIIFGLIIMEYNAYKSEKNINDINQMIDLEVSKIADNISSQIEISNDGVSSTREVVVDSTSAYNQAFKEIFLKLKEKNEDTVGWVKVNNSNIEYPVVQAKDNDYYLTHDFYKVKNTYGWVFMDYRNNSVSLDQNTILYGHNSRKKIMFTYLAYTLDEEWYKNKTNQIITFNTPYASMEWQIFSLYDINVTSDYLYTNFADKDLFFSFVDKLTSRSVYDFNVNINDNDKILTLSSCLNNGLRRVVVHAKLTKLTPNN